MIYKHWFELDDSQITKITQFVNQYKNILNNKSHISRFLDNIKHNLVYESLLKHIDLDKFNSMGYISEYILTWTPLGYLIYVKKSNKENKIDVTNYDNIKLFYNSHHRNFDEFNFNDYLKINMFTLTFNHYSGIGVSSSFTIHDICQTIDVTSYDKW